MVQAQTASRSQTALRWAMHSQAMGPVGPAYLAQDKWPKFRGLGDQLSLSAQDRRKSQDVGLPVLRPGPSQDCPPTPPDVKKEAGTWQLPRPPAALGQCWSQEAAPSCLESA